MKDFLKQLLASAMGSLLALMIIGAGGLAMLILIGTIIGKVQNIQPETEASILVIDLNASIEDAPPDVDPADALFTALTGSGEPSLYLLETTASIRRAANDPNIEGILLHGKLSSVNLGSGYPAVSELRRALDDFSNSKPVFSYLEAPSLKDYYLASAADKIVLNPAGTLEIPGLAAELLFLGDFLKRNGIDIQTLQSGKYKSAIEMFTRSSMSDTAREQLEALMQTQWTFLRDDMAKHREIDPQQFDRIANTSPILLPEQALAEGLIDEVAHKQTLFKDLEALTGKDPETGTFYQIGLFSYIEQERPTLMRQQAEGDYVAVVYAEGEIIHGKNYGDQISDHRLPIALRKFRNDEQCRAVVLRVNSPGGSALASDIIAHELKLLNESKPLVVSMGTYAASGGYWISLPAKTIFADPLTLTGSIGVFGLVPNVKDLANDYGMHFDGTKTSRFSDLFSIASPRDKEEMALLQGFVDEIYKAFIEKVAEARGLTTQEADAVSQGRVWSGLKASEHKLVDQLGGLHEAIIFATRQAGLSTESPLVEYPRRQSTEELFAQLMSADKKHQPLIQQPLSAQHPLLKKLVSLERMLTSLSDPRHVYARLPFLLME